VTRLGLRVLTLAGCGVMSTPSCSKEAQVDASAPAARATAPAPATAAAAALPGAASAAFGSAPGLQRYKESWESRLTLPLDPAQPDKGTMVTIERGSAVIEISRPAGAGATATVHFERVEKVEGPGEGTASLDPLSDQTFTVTAGKSASAAIVLQPGASKGAGPRAVTDGISQRVRERVVDAFEPDLYTQALRQTPVPGGLPQPQLATAFVRSFSARDALRGGPALQAESAGLRLNAFDGDRAIFEVSATFKSADASMSMRSSLSGDAVVDQASGQLLKLRLGGPVTLTPAGSPTSAMSGTWVEELKRERTR